MEAAFRHIDRAAGPDLLHDRIAVLVLDLGIGWVWASLALLFLARAAVAAGADEQRVGRLEWVADHGREDLGKRAGEDFLEIVVALGVAREVQAREAVVSLLGRMHDDDRLAVVIYDHEARVLQLFGAYAGTVKQSGFAWANPLLTKRRLSLRDDFTYTLAGWAGDGRPVSTLLEGAVVQAGRAAAVATSKAAAASAIPWSTVMFWFLAV